MMIFQLGISNKYLHNHLDQALSIVDGPSPLIFRVFAKCSKRFADLAEQSSTKTE